MKRKTFESMEVCLYEQGGLTGQTGVIAAKVAEVATRQGTEFVKKKILPVYIQAVLATKQSGRSAMHSVVLVKFNFR